jgi:hypothetical protein
MESGSRPGAPSRPEARGRPARGAGWVAFAATLFLILGVFNVIDGIVALAEDDNFVADELFFGDLAFWGVVMLLIGLVQLLTAYLLFAGSAIGVILGIFMASLNLVAQLFFLPAFPIWSIIIMTVDVLVIYGLTVYAEEFD